MDIKDKYINAVSARLIDKMDFSLLKIAGYEKLAALIRRRGRSLEFIFFIQDEVGEAFINFNQIPGVKKYMDLSKCKDALIINIFIDKFNDAYGRFIPQWSECRLSIFDLSVDMEQGTVSGDTSELKRLEAVLTEYANVSKLERYSPVELGSINEAAREAKPVVTRGIIAINVLMWVLMSLAGGSTNIEVLIKFGAMYSPLVLRGEYWRFITPMFLHVGIMHLAFNSYALYQLGGLAERIYGVYKFIIIYGVAGICGSFFSFIFTQAVSAGASGAIFGMLGALLYFGRKRPGVFRKGFMANLVTILLINLFIGFSNPGIDNFAHLGGLAGGYVSSRFLLK